VPVDVDLRDFAYMPVDIVRLFGSEFHAKANDAEWRAGMTLWLKSFHQVPAASVPDDDTLLARLAEMGRDLRAWRRVRSMALHGWTRCSDGRWYHPVVAEKALEAWRAKVDRRERTRRATEERERRRREEELRRDAQGHEQRNVERDDERNDERNVHQGRGIGKGIGIGRGKEVQTGVPLASLATPQPPNPGAAPAGATRRVNGHGDDPPPTTATWQAYATAYHDRYGVDPRRNATVNGHLANVVSRLGKEEAPAVAAHYVRSNRGLYVSAKHATNLLLRDCEALRTEWATGTSGTDSEARQTDRRQATGNVFGRLLAESEGKTHG
jgi:hypothetical protein